MADGTEETTLPLARVTPSAGNGRVQGGDFAPVRGLLADFFGVDPIGLPTVTKLIDGWQHVNLQAALDAYVAADGRTATQVGVTVPPPMEGSIMPVITPALSQLLAVPTVRVGTVARVNLPCGPDETMSAIRQGLILVEAEGCRLAAWIREDGLLRAKKVAVDVMATNVPTARSFLADLDELRHRHNCFRGHVVRFQADMFGNVSAEFLPRPDVRRDQLILPEALLAAIEGHAIGIAEQAEALVADGRHLKRGLLLYGPPGTGKTLTIRYLVSQLRDATVFLLTGSAMGWLRWVVEMADEIGPSVIVLDDVDLIAEDRSRGGMSPRRHLFDLLDAMDGVLEHRDVLFVATTNRVDAIEKAMSARPGRIDQAVPVPLPDADCRARLMALYGRGLDLHIDDLDALVERTNGVAASFVKELMRRAAVIALRDDETSDSGAVRAGPAEGPITVRDEHVVAALNQLLDPASPLTAVLRGGR